MLCVLGSHLILTWTPYHMCKIKKSQNESVPLFFFVHYCKFNQVKLNSGYGIKKLLGFVMVSKLTFFSELISEN